MTSTFELEIRKIIGFKPMGSSGADYDCYIEAVNGISLAITFNRRECAEMKGKEL